MAGTPSLIFYKSLCRSYKIFMLISALTGGLSLSMLSSDEMRSPPTQLARTAQLLFYSSLITAIVSIVSTSMLSLWFDTRAAAGTIDKCFAISPLLILDTAIIESWAGLVTLYASMSDGWRSALLYGQSSLFSLYLIWATVWMWSSLASPPPARLVPVGKESQKSDTAFLPLLGT
jgi:hypothetical protein